jgi:ATP-binding cassette subfamily G (WHITE) protein 2 (SNQ2)
MENSNVPLNNPTAREQTEGKTYEPINPDIHHVERDNTSTRTTSIDDAAHSSGRYNEKNTADVKGGISVQRAEAEFAQLSKELSRSSNISRRMSRIQSHNSRKGHNTTDVEKAVDGSSVSSDDEAFDLEKTLRGNRDEEEAAGIKSKRIGVSWDGLTVSGIGGVKNYVKTFPDAFVSFFNVYETAINILGLGKKGKEFNILEDFKGVAKPGEMVLVLGRPGSGCTTFLKVISNQRYGYTNIGGKVLYGPFESDFFEKRYRGEAVYCEEEENHHPTLTVGQTLDFALETKVPGKRPAGLSRQDFKDKVVNMMLKMFNIEHTKNTIVGNPFVRGVSVSFDI